MQPEKKPKPVVLEAPAPRGTTRFFPWLGLLSGVGAAVFVGHPLSMVVNNIHDYVYYNQSLHIEEDILRSFDAHMWPMLLLYSVMGGIIGAVLGYIFQRLQENRLRLDSLHQEFELQVATLRHHYKNLALGIYGFSTRIKHKLTNLDEYFRSCAREECPTYDSFHLEFESLGKNVSVLEDAAQRLTHLLGQELLFLKALTSDTLTSAPQDFYPFLVHCVQDLLGLRFREKEIRVELNGRPLSEPQESLVFQFERYTMEVILQNILANAMRFGDRLQLLVEEAGDKVRLEVRDNGPGIEVEKLRNLLSLPKRERGEESTHLGLRVSIHLLEKRGGRLLAWSKPGHGAAFIIEVPKQFRAGP